MDTYSESDVDRSWAIAYAGGLFYSEYRHGMTWWVAIVGGAALALFVGLTLWALRVARGRLRARREASA